jgi:hypothetical protein
VEFHESGYGSPKVKKESLKAEPLLLVYDKALKQELPIHCRTLGLMPVRPFKFL